MEPITQGLIGASLAGSISKKDHLKQASILGAVGGIFPDIDVLIKSDNDPLLFIDFHRHFTHSLIFSPFGSLFLACIFFFLLNKSKSSFKNIYLYIFIGFISHGLLDACTSYGTSLFWPFSNDRISWNLISVVDPFFSILLLLFFTVFLLKKSRVFVQIGTLLCLIYLVFGYVKKEKIKKYVIDLAEKRNHKIERILLKPTFGNNILWRSIYQTKNFYYLNAVYIPLFSVKSHKKGDRLNVINKNTIFSEIPENSIHRQDILRFANFSQNFIFLHPDYSTVIADLRYGSLPHDYKSLWGIEVDLKKYDQHVAYKNLRNFENDFFINFFKMLGGNLN